MDISENSAKENFDKNTHKNTPKRPRASPSDTDSKSKKLKDTMVNNTEALQAINKTLQIMQTQLTNIEVGQQSLENKIDSISSDLLSHKADTKQQFNSMQVQINSNRSRIQEQDNSIAQNKLMNQATIIGIPATYHNKVEEILETLNRSLNTSLSRNSCSFVMTTLNPSKNTCTLKIRFLAHADKVKMMTAVNDFSRDTNGKWHPLVVEDIFEELKDSASPLCGKRLSFFNSLTQTNQQIIKMKSEAKPYILTERDGRITIKKEKRSRAYELNSVDATRELINKFRNNSL